MLDSLTEKIGGLPVYAWVLLGAVGLYAFAHYKQSQSSKPIAPVEPINPKQPYQVPGPFATVIPYNPQPAGVFGGSSITP